MIPNIEFTPNHDDYDLNADTIWLGAISFEPRCAGGLQELSRLGRRLSRGILMRYSSDGSQSSPYEISMRNRESELISFGRDIFTDGIDIVEASPYSTSDLERIFRNIFESGRYKSILVDMTCFTKLHAVSLAGFVSRNIEKISWQFQYSRPDNYGSFDESSIKKWSDVLIAPIYPGASLGNEEETRGIILIGFEAHRTMIALGEVEPTGGTLIIGRMHGRPDQAKLSMHKHRKLLDRLSVHSQNWNIQHADIFDFEVMRSSVESEVEKASITSAPIFLYPFGPKPLAFSASYYLSSRYIHYSWFAYTTPDVFDLEYSEGIGHTSWFRILSI